MTPTQPTLPLALAQQLGLVTGATSAASSASATSAINTAPFSEMLKQMHQHHHTGTSKTGSSASSLTSANDETGNTDAFGVSSTTPSASSALQSMLTNPFSAIASTAQIQAQLQHVSLEL